ncbi:hypothetical protein BDB00DRAFT_876350 [Zychaea mexicana]|uniref:uncharacterized protein n=1 Tax=Zychaea mexicana TaxID=64656 RepID=UPI0022FE2DB8|nr:uncharacterized protein BDB00DRAFT_876350 [Zychaea mexicana]KAI9489476.1 hypothetical protein BDB00DRAFT_876350 [Zychaea mexicana]
MDQTEINRMAAQVQELCSDRRLSDIRVDLQKTRSAEITINRILNGGFLEGTDRDPSRLAHIILDSEDEEDTNNNNENEQPISQRERRQSSPAVELSSSPLAPRISTPPRSAVQRQISIHSSPDQPRTKTTLQNTHHSNHDNDHDNDDDDNNSLPSLDALITKMTDKEERQIDTIELDETPPRKYDALALLDARDETEASLPRRQSLGDLLKEWEDDLEEDEANQPQQEQKKRSSNSKRSRSSSNSNPGKQKPKKRKSPSAEIDYLKPWSSSSDNSDKDEEQEEEGQSSHSREETTQEKRERLKKEIALQRKEQQKARKEAKKAERERAKQEKKAEKERKRIFEQANKLRTNRHELLAEMILDVQPLFNCSTRGELLKEVIESKEAQVHVADTGLHTIGWRRKTQATWDEEQGTFIPHPDNQVHIIEEPFVLVFMDMQQLCTLVKSTDMDTQIDRIQNRAGASRKIMLMIEGLETYYKRKTLLIQRDFNSAVLVNLGQADAGASGSRRKRASTAKSDTIMEAARTGPTKAEMEEKLTYLQMMKSVRLVPTVDQADSVDWIVALTADIANAMNRNINFFKHQGPAKSGTDAADTWSKMLQEIQLCTPAVARAITSAYPNLPSLHHAYQRTPDTRDKQELLADLEVERSVLSQRDRTISVNMSKKIYTIFTCTDDQHYIA